MALRAEVPPQRQTGSGAAVQMAEGDGSAVRRGRLKWAELCGSFTYDMLKDGRASRSIAEATAC